MGVFDLSGAVALVTGGAGGIGAQVVRSLAEAGATVIATDLAAEAEITGAAQYYRQDATDPARWTEIIAAIEADHGRLDILVNNAGIASVESIEGLTLDAFRRCISVNLDSTFLGTQAARALLAKSGASRAGGSSIVNLSSVGGLKGAPYLSAYCAAKGAVKLFSKSAAAEFGVMKLPIRVNSICPGGIDTPMMDEIYSRYIAQGLVPDLATARAGVEQAHALGRMGTPDEIAAAITFLCSPAASFVTGTELVADGGMTAF